MSDYPSHSWDQQESFQDIMAEQIKKAPWFLISILAHAIPIILLWNVPWESARDTKLSQTAVDEQIIDEMPPEEPEEEEEPPEPEEEEEIVEILDIVDTEEIPEDDVPTLDQTDSPFDKDAFNDIIGIGGGAGGGSKFGGRFRRKRGAAPKPAEMAVQEALRWLRDHQDADGKWDTDGFDHHCPPDDKCTGPGHALHDVGITGLALLAFLGDGNTLREGEHREVVRNGIQWLRDQQDESGLIGEAAGHTFMYSHIIATVALCEAFGLSRYTVLRNPVQNAINYLQRARNPYRVWRYHPRDGDNDSSVTGWAVIALASAQSFSEPPLNLKVDEAAFQASIAWFDEMTDPNTGRIGYTQRGSPPARPSHLMDKFPASKSECMTAVGLMARFFAGQDFREAPVMVQHADLMLKTPPVWADDGSIDMYYWYYGSFAMYQMGGRWWKEWSTRMEKAVIGSQIRGNRHNRGSWDPVGVWGEDGGRVYSTAILALCLQVYFRYSRIIGAR